MLLWFSSTSGSALLRVQFRICGNARRIGGLMKFGSRQETETLAWVIRVPDVLGLD